MNTILFPGSFNPFTVGHRSLVERVLPLFDRVVIAIGVNSQKACEARTRERLDAIRALYAAEPKVSVIAYSGLTVDACEAEGARCAESARLPISNMSATSPTSTGASQA